MNNSVKLIIGPLAWAYAIIIGGVLLLTPGGIGPIVTNVAGVLGIGLGAAGFYFRGKT